MKLVYDFLFIAGIIFGCIYIYILCKSKDKALHKLILIAFFGLLVFTILESYASIHKIHFLLRVSFLPIQGVKLILAPLLLLYIQSLFLEDKKVLKSLKIHIVPYLVFVLFVSLPYLIGFMSQKYFVDYQILIHKYLPIKRFILNCYFLLYLYISFHTFYKFKKVLKCNYSHIEHNNFIWVRYLLIASLIVIVADLLFVVYQLLFGFLPWRTQSVTILFASFAVLYAAYYGIKQSKVLIPYFLIEDTTINSTKKEHITKQQQEEFSTLEQLLIQCMLQEKPYLDEELTLHKLASAMGITDKKLSKLLNQHIEISFYKFVNSYRIEEFKKLVCSASHAGYTIEGIAYEAGFKSKASFYRIFKNQTGQSPTDFKNQVLKDHSTDRK
ncbi:helix-turn-helix domain-containing protein [Kordia sp.]|uniref:helix-turn-helix domain-containing protein n=1 Tax=Kordia sp. TaxID=1965332 RepID=UPI003B5AB821